jgi:hypothetical protein
MIPETGRSFHDDLEAVRPARRPEGTVGRSVAVSSEVHSMITGELLKRGEAWDDD